MKVPGCIMYVINLRILSGSNLISMVQDQHCMSVHIIFILVAGKFFDNIQCVTKHLQNNTVTVVHNYTWNGIVTS
jgi:hypothetical protein